MAIIYLFYMNFIDIYLWLANIFIEDVISCFNYKNKTSTFDYESTKGLPAMSFMSIWGNMEVKGRLNKFVWRLKWGLQPDSHVSGIILAYIRNFIPILAIVWLLKVGIAHATIFQIDLSSLKTVGCVENIEIGILLQAARVLIEYTLNKTIHT